MKKQKLFYSLPLIDRLGHMSTELFYLRNLYPIEQYDYNIFIPPVALRPNTNTFMLKKATEGMNVIETEDDNILLAGYKSGPTVTTEVRNGDLHILLDGSQLFNFFLMSFHNKQLPFHYTLTQEEIARGSVLRSQFGIPEQAHVVTLHVRDRGFLPHLNYHAYRDANIEHYIPAIEYLMSLGIYVVRIGDSSMKKIGGLPPNFIDAPFHPAYDHFVEPYFLATSLFHFGMITGPSSIAVSFKKPMLSTNTLLCVADWGHPGDLAMPRKFYSHKLNRFLTYEEILFSPLISYWKSELFDQAGIQLVENSSLELLNAAKEMIGRFTGEYRKLDEIEKLNNRIKGIQQRLHNERVAANAVPPLYAPFMSQHQFSHSFVEMNPWFLGHDFG